MKNCFQKMGFLFLLLTLANCADNTEGLRSTPAAVERPDNQTSNVDPIIIDSDDTTDPLNLNIWDVFEDLNILPTQPTILPESEALLNAPLPSADLQALDGFQVEQNQNLQRPELLAACSNLQSYTSQFGCTQAVQYDTVSGDKAWASADVKIYKASINPSFSKLAFLVAPHNFEAPTSINHEFLYSVNSQTRRLFRELQSQGVAVAFIGFGHPLHNLKIVRSKALAVAAAIQNINSLKSTPSSSALMGLSLGGVIGRVALRHLEFTAPGSHQVSHYVSVDSPHKGAHVPLGLQGIMPFLENGTRAGIAKSENFRDLFGWLIDDFLDLDSVANTLDEGIANGQLIAEQIEFFSKKSLYSSFAQELLIQQTFVSGFSNPRYQTLQSYLDSIGMPQETISNIGVASGSSNGTSLGLRGNYYLSFNSNKRNYVEIDFTSYITKTENTIFYGVYKYPDPTEILGDSILGTGGGTDSYILRLNDSDAAMDLDNLPCGYLDAVSELSEQVGHAMSSMFPEKIQVGNGRTCFIPTRSALAVNHDNLESSSAMGAQESLFDVIIAEPANKKHLDVSPNMMTEIIDLVKSAYDGRVTGS